jgi:hypothetical protein
MARKRFVLVVEGDVDYHPSHMIPVIGRGLSPAAMALTPGLLSPKYFVGAWTDEDEWMPTILDGLGSDREYAELVVASWNRLERSSWYPEDASS